MLKNLLELFNERIISHFSLSFPIVFILSSNNETMYCPLIVFAILNKFSRDNELVSSVLSCNTNLG